MSLRILFEGSVSKHLESPEENEDAYRTAPERGRIVLSDGASESYDPKHWANLLVETFATSELSAESCSRCVEAYEALHEPASLSWSRAAAYERGSFATLMIVQDHPQDLRVAIKSVGDSLAVLTDGQRLLRTAPYSTSTEFSLNPTLLATKPEHNSALEFGKEGSEPCFTWEYEPQGYLLLLCMTDALGAWLLKHQEQDDPTALERLLAIREISELEELVESERESGLLRRDDTTLIITALVGCD